METELKLPCEWPEDFTYTDEGGLTQEQAEEAVPEAEAGQEINDPVDGSKIKTICDLGA